MSKQHKALFLLVLASWIFGVQLFSNKFHFLCFAMPLSGKMPNACVKLIWVAPLSKLRKNPTLMRSLCLL